MKKRRRKIVENDTIESSTPNLRLRSSTALFEDKQDESYTDDGDDKTRPQW